MRAGWSITLAALSCFVAILAGAASGFAGERLQHLLMGRDPVRRLLATLIIAEIVVFLGAAVFRGLGHAVRWLLVPFSTVVLAATLVAASTGGTGLVGIAFLAFSLIIVAIFCLSVAARAAAGAGGNLVFVAVGLASAAAGHLYGGGLVALAIALAALYIGRSTVRGGSLNPLVSRTTARIACAGGTSFREADLRGAHLEAASLACSDFRGALLEGASFEDAKLRLCAFDEGARPSTARASS